MITTREQLDNLIDGLINNIVRITDDEILREVEEEFGDHKHVANKGREILKRVKEKLKKEAE